jgi:hypothetical protein
MSSYTAAGRVGEVRLGAYHGVSGCFSCTKDKKGPRVHYITCCTIAQRMFFFFFFFFF